MNYINKNETFYENFETSSDREQINNCRRKKYYDDTRTEEEYIVVSHALDPITMQKSRLQNPYVIKVRQESVLQLYGLKFEKVVNAEAKEQIINNQHVNYTGCNDGIENPTCGLIYENGNLVPFSQGFCCSCHSKANGSRQTRKELNESVGNFSSKIETKDKRSVNRSSNRSTTFRNAYEQSFNDSKLSAVARTDRTERMKEGHLIYSSRRLKQNNVDLIKNENIEDTTSALIRTILFSPKMQSKGKIEPYIDSIKDQAIRESRNLNESYNRASINSKNIVDESRIIVSDGLNSKNYEDRIDDIGKSKRKNLIDELTELEKAYDALKKMRKDKRTNRSTRNVELTRYIYKNSKRNEFVDNNIEMKTNGFSMHSTIENPILLTTDEDISINPNKNINVINYNFDDNPTIVNKQYNSSNNEGSIKDNDKLFIFAQKHSNITILIDRYKRSSKRFDRSKKIYRNKLKDKRIVKFSNTNVEKFKDNRLPLNKVIPSNKSSFSLNPVNGVEKSTERAQESRYRTNVQPSAWKARQISDLIISRSRLNSTTVGNPRRNVVPYLDLDDAKIALKKINSSGGKNLALIYQTADKNNKDDYDDIDDKYLHDHGRSIRRLLSIDRSNNNLRGMKHSLEYDEPQSFEYEDYNYQQTTLGREKEDRDDRLNEMIDLNTVTSLKQRISMNDELYESSNDHKSIMNADKYIKHMARVIANRSNSHSKLNRNKIYNDELKVVKKNVIDLPIYSKRDYYLNYNPERSNDVRKIRKNFDFNSENSNDELTLNQNQKYEDQISSFDNNNRIYQTENNLRYNDQSRSKQSRSSFETLENDSIDPKQIGYDVNDQKNEDIDISVNGNIHVEGGINGRPISIAFVAVPDVESDVDMINNDSYFNEQNSNLNEINDRKDSPFNIESNVSNDNKTTSNIDLTTSIIFTVMVDTTTPESIEKSQDQKEYSIETTKISKITEYY
ncbi:putative uncharacterized protein DDB_G0282133 [Vespa velutina]|uniref:putative uncharacterized protein DDB_G0282133 n=1 Tax=Vespa velutina TaxID=202808 RepID=UPI001FB2DAF6|nr:putative uncharacterized protein DDB_G0282133 [Vespa velutina]